MPRLAQIKPVIADCSFVPERSDDPARVLALVERDGGGILTGCGPTESDARAAVRAVLGAHVLALPEAAAVREGGEKDRKPHDPDGPLPLHTDGFAYGDQACDYFGLSCVRRGESGGESVLVDSYRLIDAIDPELRAFLLNTAVDHSEPDMRPALSPLAITTAAGRVAVRKTPFVRPASDTADADQVAAMLARWSAVVAAQFVAAPRFMLNVGDVAMIDNYRVLHGRDEFTGERFMWRVWAWTDRGNGVPTGMLHSDSRYAATT